MNKNSNISQNILNLAEKILPKIVTFNSRPSIVFIDFFRSYPRCGQRDRKLIIDIIYSILRHWESFSWIAIQKLNDKISFNRKLVLLGMLAIRKEWLTHFHFGNYNNLLNFAREQRTKDFFEWIRHYSHTCASQDENCWLLQTMHLFLDSFGKQILPDNVVMDLPNWILEELYGYWSQDFLMQLAFSMKFTAATDLRINILKIHREKMIQKLRTQGVDVSLGKYSDTAIRLTNKINLTSVFPISEGLFEIQDEGSQLVCQVVAPLRGEMIMDFCAGAGGKTLALAAMMRNTGKIFSIDQSAKRLARLKPRLERSGVQNVHSILIENENDVRLNRFIDKMDKVLVDAPCSGVGTLRRHPYLKSWYNTSSLKNFSERQLVLIKCAANFVKKGGKLIYATCSFLPQENEKVVDLFLKENKRFVLFDAMLPLKKQGIELPLLEQNSKNALRDISEKSLRLFPSVHMTDGFFVAVMTRIC